MANTSMNIRMDSEAKINQPNGETVEAIHEGEKIIKENTSRFESADEMFADLGI